MTKVLKINAENPEGDKILTAAGYVKRGKVLVYPTETVYGIGCSILGSVDRIFKIKKRGRDNPLSVAFSSLEMAEKYMAIDDDERWFIRNHSNKPHTFVVRKKKIPDIVTAGKDTVGVRIPKHVVAREIIEMAGIPIISTSANISGDAPPVSIGDISEGIKGKADLIIDSGPCRIGKPSKVVDLRSGRVLRS